uniref:Uncharacterized protein n=1 Tax=viral metagenome TaxID=1070528 RepID=A0A6M3X6E4_9ZZZZ
MKILSKKAEIQIKKMQYHQLMSKKHSGKARHHYTILLKIFGNKEVVKKVLKNVGIKNDEFNKGVIEK